MSSADDESESGDEFTLWDIKDNLDTEPFEVVLKGGSPWGFTITGGSEVRSPIQISEISEDGKAERSGQLKLGDFLLGVNGIKCVSQTEAVELIKGAFRTVALTIWRGTSKLESSVKVLRSSSFLQKAREAQERERTRLGIQDDSIVHKESSKSMKQKPRRIESFHGSRTRHQYREQTPSVSSSTDASAHSYHTADSKDVKEGATVQNAKEDNSLPMEQPATTPTTKVKEWPTMADLSQQKQNSGHHGYYNSHLSPSKSSPNLDKDESYDMKSVNYSSPLLNKSSPNIHDDIKKSSSSSATNLANQKWFPTSAYQKPSPRPFNNTYSPSYSKHNSNDYQNLQDIQQSINQSNLISHNLPPPIEKEEDPELQGLTKGDNRPLCSPPAPPTRDISSLKFVPLTSQQSHAKYPSWPVTQPSAETNDSGEPINSPHNLYNEQNANLHNVRSLKDRNSPNSDRKASDRNASDPGFKKTLPFAVFMKRPDQKHVQYGSRDANKKEESNAKIDEFFEREPGYQQPIFDQDGHRIGDEKYNVSPPERESSGNHRGSHKIDNRHDRYVPQYKGYNDPRITRDSGSNPILSPTKDSKSSFNFPNSDKSLNVVTNKFTDSSTSPMQSPNQSKPVHSATMDNVQTNDPKMHSYIVNKKTMVCFNTGTQTEFNSPKKKSPVSPGLNSHFNYDLSHQGIQTSPENTNRDDQFVHMRKNSQKGSDRYESHSRPKSTSEKDKILLSNINSELDSNDQHSAPFMRRLARDLLANQSQEHKRRSTSSSGGSGLRSPSSDYSHYFGELRESDSCSSVIIHDDVSEADTITPSRHDVIYSEQEHLHQFENRSKSARRSLDPSMFSQKYSRGLQSARSEVHLSSGSSKDHTMSMTNIHVPSSAREDNRPKMSHPSTSDSSTPSHRTGSSTGTFSSTGTHYSFEASPGPFVPQSIQGRRESSDSVFTEDRPDKRGDNSKNYLNMNDKKKSPNWVGRTQSMKKAYGTYDETQTWHKKQESDVSSSSSGDNHLVIMHGRSQSETNYLPMDAIRKNSEKQLGAINEESSETRWQDALRKSQRSSQSSFDQPYTDLDVKKHVNEKLREYQSKTELERNLKRTSSEQIRPMKEKIRTPSESKFEGKMQRSNSRDRMSPSQSQTDLRSSFERKEGGRMTSPSASRTDLRMDSDRKSSTGRRLSPSGSRSDLRQESENRKPLSPAQSQTDLGGQKEDLKRVLQNFMYTKTGRLPSDEEVPSNSPSNGQPQQTMPERPTRLSVTESFRKKYAEGDKLRRSRSISSTDSGNYTEMRPPIRPQQTEWSRVRSQTRRPLSIGSDSSASLVDPYAVTPITGDHTRTPSDSLESPRTDQNLRESVSSRDSTPQRYSIAPRKHVPIIISSPRYSGPRMGPSTIYQNLMQDNSGYRKPLPPTPPTDEEKPPELPPRNYRSKDISQSDSQLLPPRHYKQPPQEESHENYVEQLRKFSRRYSEQQSASMVYLSSKTQTHITQSYQKPEVKSLEATQPQATSPTLRDSPQQYTQNLVQSSQPRNTSPSVSRQSPSSSRSDSSIENRHDNRQPPPSPRQSPRQSPTVKLSPHHSPTPSLLRQISSPEPPPPPTPMKDIDEFDQELPPPPPEVIQGQEMTKEGFSDDSYLSHKTKGDSRQIGQYKRSATAGDIHKISPETNNNKIEKPPRRRLHQPWQQQNLGSENSEQNTDNNAVPRFSASESRVNPTVVKSVAQPLDKNHIQPRPLGNSYSASALQTPRPFTSVTENLRKESNSADRLSVRDQISSYEKKATPDRVPVSNHSFNSGDRNSQDSGRPSLPQQSESLNNGVQDGTARLTFDNDSSSTPRRTSFPPERHKQNYLPKYDDKKLFSHVEFNGNVPSESKKSSYLSQRDGYSKYHPEHDNNSQQSISTSRFDSKHSSQTSNFNSANEQEIVSCHTRQRSQEELECDEKVSEIAKKDQRLKQVLQVDNKARMDFMNGLFPLDEPVRQHSSPNHSPQSSSVRDESANRQEDQKSPLDPSSLPPDYFKSSPKAKIEMDMRGKSDELNQEVSKEIRDPDTLIKTKEELVRSIQKKVEKLKEEKGELQRELDDVEEVGMKIVKLVQEKCRTQQEKDKFNSYITDMEKIIKLLLKLSGLLARAENALQSLPENSSPTIKKMAVDKRDRLQAQHEEAKTLKDDIDKRSAQVSTFLQESLSDSEFEDYKYFVQMKSKLTIEMQEFEDKITLGQEQILGLKRNIPGK